MASVHTDIARLAELDLVARTQDGRIFVSWDEIDVQRPGGLIPINGER